MRRSFDAIFIGTGQPRWRWLKIGRIDILFSNAGIEGA
jgi:hypothetical protein